MENSSFSLREDDQFLHYVPCTEHLSNMFYVWRKKMKHDYSILLLRTCTNQIFYFAQENTMLERGQTLYYAHNLVQAAPLHN
jgi:hypothetical protein